MSEPTLAHAEDPPPEPAAPLPPKTKRTWLYVGIAAAAAIIVVVVIAVLVSNGTAASAPSPTAVAAEETDEAEPAAEEETTKPTPTPEAAPGTFENPYPLGTAVSFTDRATGQDVLTAQVRQMGQAEYEITTGTGVETPPAPEGLVNVFIEYTTTNLSPDQPYDAVDESGYWQVVDEDGNEYPVYARRIADQNVLPVEPGASWEAHAIYQVPADATGLMLLIYDAYIKL